jgi:hypothetical protein
MITWKSYTRKGLYIVLQAKLHANRSDFVEKLEPSEVFWISSAVWTCVSIALIYPNAGNPHRRISSLLQFFVAVQLWYWKIGEGSI